MMGIGVNSKANTENIKGMLHFQVIELSTHNKSKILD